MAQDIQVLGERDPKDKLKNINLTRSVRLNDLTQEEMAKLYRRGKTNATTGSLNNGFKFDYLFESNAYNVALDVVAIAFHSSPDAVVFDCGYSVFYDRFFKVLLSKTTDGSYSLSQWISAPAWVDKDNLKTVNGQSLVGTGDIEIAAGNKVYDLTDMNVDERIALYNALKDRTITLMNSTIAYYNNAAGEEAIMTSMVMNDTDGAIFSFLYKGKIFGLNLKSDGTYEIIRTWEE